MPNMPLGISTWTLNGLLPDDLRPVVDGSEPCPSIHLQAVRAYFVEMVTAIVHSNIKAVQLWHSPVFDDELVAEQLQRLKSAHRVSSIHAPFGPNLDISSPDGSAREAGVDACIRAAELLAALGGSVLVVHGSAAVDNPHDMPERGKQAVLSLGEIADQCADLHVQVAVELLPGLAVGSSSPELLALLELVGRPNAGVCLDVNHVFPQEHLYPSVYALGPRILALHISDYDGVSEKHWLPGLGTIDWTQLIHDLGQVGCTAPFTYEVRFEADSLDDVISVVQDNYARLTEAAG